MHERPAKCTLLFSHVRHHPNKNIPAIVFPLARLWHIYFVRTPERGQATVVLSIMDASNRMTRFMPCPLRVAPRPPHVPSRRSFHVIVSCMFKNMAHKMKGSHESTQPKYFEVIRSPVCQIS